MSDESWFEDPDYFDAYMDSMEEGIDCDYGLSEFCEDPSLRSTGCCFECPLYLEAAEIEAGVYDFHFFWLTTERGWWDDELRV